MATPKIKQITKEDIDLITIPLNNTQHKGSSGRVCIIGGSAEYTGAPYFAGIAAYKTGADLVHIITTKDAAPVIKGYSPDLIVHPILDTEYAVENCLKLLNRMHAVVVHNEIGPGLGREEATLQIVLKIAEGAIKMQIPMVVDGDALFLLQHHNFVQGYPYAVLTPNLNEFKRLYESKHLQADSEGTSACRQLACSYGGVTVLEKNTIDQGACTDSEEEWQCKESGSSRRCGGQGDILAGVLGTLLAWIHIRYNDERGPTKFYPLGAITASYITRKTAQNCWDTHGRSFGTTELIHSLGRTAEEILERTSS